MPSDMRKTQGGWVTLYSQEFYLISLLKGTSVFVPECEFHGGKVGPVPTTDVTF